MCHVLLISVDITEHVYRTWMGLMNIVNVMTTGVGSSAEVRVIIIIIIIRCISFVNLSLECTKAHKIQPEIGRPCCWYAKCLCAINKLSLMVWGMGRKLREKNKIEKTNALLVVKHLYKQIQEASFETILGKIIDLKKNLCSWLPPPNKN